MLKTLNFPDEYHFLERRDIDFAAVRGLAAPPAPSRRIFASLSLCTLYKRIANWIQIPLSEGN